MAKNQRDFFLREQIRAIQRELGEADPVATEANNLREQVEKNLEPVGEKFAEEARKIHYGEAPERGIYGDATPEQTEELHDEGIPVYALPWSKKKRKLS